MSFFCIPSYFIFFNSLTFCLSYAKRAFLNYHDDKHKVHDLHKLQDWHTVEDGCSVDIFFYRRWRQLLQKNLTEASFRNSLTFQKFEIVMIE